ncbi:MAG: hypothetical protein ABIQ73_23665 [Acidimicrobiales bacterium]
MSSAGSTSTTGQEWLIFALPPAELGIHPGEGPTFDSGIRHQVTFMCDDITTTIALPGGLDVMLYQPRHATAI